MTGATAQGQADTRAVRAMARASNASAANRLVSGRYSSRGIGRRLWIQTAR